MVWSFKSSAICEGHTQMCSIDFLLLHTVSVYFKDSNWKYFRIIIVTNQRTFELFSVSLLELSKICVFDLFYEFLRIFGECVLIRSTNLPNRLIRYGVSFFKCKTESASATSSLGYSIVIGQKRLQPLSGLRR